MPPRRRRRKSRKTAPPPTWRSVQKPWTFSIKGIGAHPKRTYELILSQLAVDEASTKKPTLKEVVRAQVIEERETMQPPPGEAAATPNIDSNSGDGDGYDNNSDSDSSNASVNSLLPLMGGLGMLELRPIRRHRRGQQRKHVPPVLHRVFPFIKECMSCACRRQRGRRTRRTSRKEGGKSRK